jgi:hypothetical protein
MNADDKEVQILTENSKQQKKNQFKQEEKNRVDQKTGYGDKKLKGPNLPST